jgi:very-short-patch-repair endonuclease
MREGGSLSVDMGAKNIIVGQKVDDVKVQRAKELRRELTDEEKLLWQYLRKNRLGGFHFRRQQVIQGFIVDFYCHKAGLVVELDGGVHEDQIEYDQERDKVLEGRDLRILRVRNEEIQNNLQEVLARIEAACREEG